MRAGTEHSVNVLSYRSLKPSYHTSFCRIFVLVLSLALLLLLVVVVVVGCWLLVVGFGFLLLVVGCWLLVVGC